MPEFAVVVWVKKSGQDINLVESILTNHLIRGNEKNDQGKEIVKMQHKQDFYSGYIDSLHNKKIKAEERREIVTSLLSGKRIRKATNIVKESEAIEKSSKSKKKSTVSCKNKSFDQGEGIFESDSDEEGEILEFLKKAHNKRKEIRKEASSSDDEPKRKHGLLHGVSSSEEDEPTEVIKKNLKEKAVQDLYKCQSEETDTNSIGFLPMEVPLATSTQVRIQGSHLSQFLEDSQPTSSLPGLSEGSMLVSYRDLEQFAKKTEVMELKAQLLDVKTELEELKKKFTKLKRKGILEAPTEDPEDLLANKIKKAIGCIPHGRTFDSVLAAMEAAFSLEEIAGSSISGKPANSKTKPKPVLHPTRYRIVANILVQNFEELRERLVLTAKVHAVQKHVKANIKKSEK